MDEHAEAAGDASAGSVSWSHGALSSVGERYRIEARIGSGGMADVYRAHDELLGRTVALKVFRDAGSADDLRRQESEVRILAALSHPHLVTLFDAVPSSDGHGVLVLEHVDGSDLRTLLQAGPLRASAAAEIGAQVAEVLAYIHDEGVVHRDVSPGNILLFGGPAEGVTVKLTDLGIARLIDDSRITATGAVIGTARYMSPEQARGERVGASADVYSLGLVLLECLTGRREFPGTAFESAAARLLSDPEVPDELPVAWRRLLGAMTARDAAARPAAREVEARLREIELAIDDVVLGRAAAPAAGRARPVVAPAFGVDPAEVRTALLPVEALPTTDG